MAKSRVIEFEKAISRGELVYIYFAVGKGVEGDNEIVYRANVLKIVSNRDCIPSPDKSATPSEWKDLNNKIWIQIADMKGIENLKACDFIVPSTGSNLEQVISKSQYHFGYIELINK